jgi:nucleoside diphosphate kinase
VFDGLFRACEQCARGAMFGLRIVGMKLMQIDESLARRHYAIHEGKAFFDSLITYITSGPVVVLVVTGKNIIEIVHPATLYC